jgi:hypothetical protein
MITQPFKIRTFINDVYSQVDNSKYVRIGGMFIDIDMDPITMRVNTNTTMHIGSLVRETITREIMKKGKIKPLRKDLSIPREHQPSYSFTVNAITLDEEIIAEKAIDFFRKKADRYTTMYEKELEEKKELQKKLIAISNYTFWGRVKYILKGLK